MLLKHLWECLTVWSVPPTSLQGAQAILAHSAGENSPTDPGLVNKFIADKIKELYHHLKVPVIIQGELKPCLFDIPLTAASPRQAETAPNYMNTYDIALWQKAECDKLGVQRVVLVSYYPHYWRAVRATEKVGLTVLVPPGLREGYDPNNSQKWVRYKWVNRLYELLLARPYSLWKGWI